MSGSFAGDKLANINTFAAALEVEIEKARVAAIECVEYAETEEEKTDD